MTHDLLLLQKAEQMENGTQVKSKKRVADHGEVFTAEREVNAMLDLVKQETERIESRFLEPACGDGNFLAEILRRKLAVVKKQYGKSPFDYEKFSVIAVSSIYGVELLSDNAQQCRERLFDIWDKEYSSNCKKETSEECRDAVHFILKRNILCGNALDLRDASGNPIIFSEWTLQNGIMFKRKDYRLDVLLNEHPDPGMYSSQLTLFSDDASTYDNWMLDEETNTVIPRPVKEFPMVDYRKVQQYE